MIHTFRNIDYTGGSDLVKCNNCDTMMVVPSTYAVCPLCGKVGCLSDIEQDCELDIAGWEDPIIADDAVYKETQEGDVVLI